MLSRTAEGLYWMARYLERAQNGCRLLAEQFIIIEDRPVEQIDQSWRRLYIAAGRTPLGGHLEPPPDDEDFMLADAYTLADDLTFEPTNPDAIRNCFAAARESARQVRNIIPDKMWSALNLAYFDLRDVEIENIWNDQPGSFYERTEGAIRTISGVAEGTIYRDDGWHFLQLGRFVERVQSTAALMDAHIALFPTDAPDCEADWLSLLWISEAHFAYRRLYSLERSPSRMVDFLVTDPSLSHSIRHALGRIVDALDAVAVGPALKIEAERRAGRMGASSDHDWPDRDRGDDDATRAALREIGESCRLLHQDIAAAYFDYEVKDAS